MQSTARPPLLRAARARSFANVLAAASPLSTSYKEAPSAAPAVVRDRAKAALLGALLADAATMSLHWHYDQGQIKRKVLREADGPLQAVLGLVFADGEVLDSGRLAALAPEFFEPPGNMFYTYPLGTCARRAAPEG
jgi:hypothetical protein